MQLIYKGLDLISEYRKCKKYMEFIRQFALRI